MTLRANLQNAFNRIGVEMRARTPRALSTPANIVSTSTILSAVPALTFNAVAGRTYHVKFIGSYQTAATNTGCRIGMTGTAAGSFRGWFKGAVATAVGATEQSVPISAISAVLITTGVTPAVAPHYVGGEYVFICTTSGTHQIAFASETGTAATLLAGSTLIVQEF